MFWNILWNIQIIAYWKTEATKGFIQHCNFDANRETSIVRYATHDRCFASPMIGKHVAIPPRSRSVQSQFQLHLDYRTIRRDDRWSRFLCWRLFGLDMPRQQFSLHETSDDNCQFSSVQLHNTEVTSVINRTSRVPSDVCKRLSIHHYQFCSPVTICLLQKSCVL